MNTNEQVVDQVFQAVMSDIGKHYKVSDRLSDILSDSLSEHLPKALSRRDAEVVEKLRSFAEAVARTDKTPRYEYERTTANKNNEGKLPGMGQRWSTPREMARDVLAALKDQTKEQ